jgi:hypothetical protein
MTCPHCGETHGADNPVRPEDYAAHGLLAATPDMEWGDDFLPDDWDELATGESLEERP